IPSGLTNAVAASTGQLNLSNSGDSVTLKSASGATADTVTYGASLAGTDGVSFNRAPDVTGTSYALHTSVGGASVSPGKRASGAAF
ncbi:MAG: endonuclease, partial [Cystobacter sp.]